MENTLLKEIGVRMAQSRKRAGYTQERLGELTGLSAKMISAAENGHKAMRPENIVKICECLSISTDYLLKGEEAELRSFVGTGRISALTARQKAALQSIVDGFLSAFE